MSSSIAEQLKYDELRYQITTQEVTLIKAAQVILKKKKILPTDNVEVAFENKGQTLENIVMKTNVKLRGMNHVTRGDGYDNTIRYDILNTI